MERETYISKRPVSMTLSTEVLRRAGTITSDLSETVENLLTTFVEAEESKRADIAAQISQWATASNTVIERYGLPGEDDNPA